MMRLPRRTRIDRPSLIILGERRYLGDQPIWKRTFWPGMPDAYADPSQYDDDPDRVRTTLRTTRSGSWLVFETLAADGSLAIGISSTKLPPGTVMVVYDGLTKDVAEQAAAGYHRWRLRQTAD